MLLTGSRRSLKSVFAVLAAVPRIAALTQYIRRSGGFCRSVYVCPVYCGMTVETRDDQDDVLDGG